ncbi:hypothetical protein LT85_4113 [Collimonas arenae]|uniref:Uncharacterized protein n=1 Tax=Collimonas arenae TaxID=279058 RepID=A0A0A1FFK6_9BURK|nr:hypothetical protein LT85_4113 [Collimonas arenae]
MFVKTVVPAAAPVEATTSEVATCAWVEPSAATRFIMTAGQLAEAAVHPTAQEESVEESTPEEKLT